MSKRTKGETCEEVLLDYIRNNPGWHKKVHLYAVAEDWSPETVGRDLRMLNENGFIYRDWYKGTRTRRDLAMYSIVPKEEVKAPQYEIVEVDGKPVARLVN